MPRMGHGFALCNFGALKQTPTATCVSKLHP
jgi:hypothetical protein